MAGGARIVRTGIQVARSRRTRSLARLPWASDRVARLARIVVATRILGGRQHERPGRADLDGAPEQRPTVSVGIVDGQVLCDLDYSEDSRAEVDFNLVMTGAGEFIEVQGSAEGKPFRRDQLAEMLEVGEQGLRRIFELQQAALETD